MARRKKRIIHENLRIDRARLVIPRPTDSDEAGTAQTIRIDEVQPVGSYSWVETPVPTILVPGSPPIWVGKPTPFQLEKGQGRIRFDMNGSRFRNMPLLPLFKAIDHSHGQPVDWASIDFVTDRRSLREIMAWACGSNRSFRVDTQLAGRKSVLLSVWTQWAADGMLYGHSFEKEATRCGDACEDCSSHHRMIIYKLGDLRMLVRYEADACIETFAHYSPHVSSSQPNTHTFTSRHHLGTAHGLAVYRGGIPVHESTIVELKTSKEHVPFQPVHLNWSKHYPQLYFSQTQHMLVATHKDGLVHTVMKGNISEGTEAVLPFLLKLRKLHRALKSIQETLVDVGEQRKLSLVNQDGELEAFERIDRRPCLPKEVLDRFSKVPV